MRCYLCNEEITLEQVNNRKVRIVGSELVHNECQEDAEMEARLENDKTM